MESSNHVSDEQLIESVDNLSRVFSIRRGLHLDQEEEIHQEIAVALLKARERFDPEKASWRTFAYEIAQYTVKEYFRENVIDNKKWQRRTHSPILHVPLDELLTEPSVNDYYDTLYLDEFLETCRTPRDRFMVLCLLAGFSQTEIERIMNVRLGALSRSIQRLRIVSSKYSSFLQMD